MEGTVEQSSVKEHEIMAVTALIEEKASLNEQKVALKKQCREEKAKLDKELDRITKRNEELMKAEHAEFLAQIEAEFDMENEKLLEQRKQIAEVNVQTSVMQRKIDNIPSKIEMT
jgi:predicted  nucleic acid-binding Zn-ribbon protein